MDAPSSADSGLICLALVARFHGVAAEPSQLKHSIGLADKSLSMLDMLRAMRKLGLRARTFSCRKNNLEGVPLPAIAQHVDGHFFIVAKLAEDRVLIQDPLENRPQVLPRQKLPEIWNGSLILVSRRIFSAWSNDTFGFGWFLPAIKKYRKLFGEVLLASFFLQLFALITPLFFQVVVDKVLVHRGLTTLDVLAVGLLVVSVFDVLLGGLRNYLFSHTTNRVDVALGSRLFEHLLALPISYFSSRRVGDSVARVRELETIRNFLTGSAVTLVIDLLFTIVFFAVMYLYSPVLTGIVLGAIPFYVLLSAMITPILRRRLNEKFARGAENQAFLVESVTAVETLKSMAVEPQMQRCWEDQLAGYVAASFRAANLGNIASQIAGLVNKVTVVLILWIGARLVILGELSVGELIAFNMLAGRVSSPILRVVQLWQDFQQAGISVRRLGDILNTPKEPGYNPGRTSLPAIKGEIAFERVTFRYSPERSAVLQDVSLQVKPGQVIGIVGRSGSGKSTLSKLIQRLYVPETGRLLIDGVDLSLVEPAWLRRQVGVVLQESILFNRSVRDNIAIADPGMSMERIVNSARTAGADEFILELPEGYDTIVGEQGSNLSGGQRQRIVIARALITDPRILILDEATSALDYESERIIQENMRAICKGRTVFIIAHRLSAVRQCDRILVIDKGRIVEEGDHHELIIQQGQYAGLHALQGGVA